MEITAQSEGKLELLLYLFKCQKSHLAIPNWGKVRFFWFCSRIFDIAHYCVTQPVELFKKKETMRGWDTQGSSSRIFDIAHCYVTQPVELFEKKETM